MLFKLRAGLAARLLFLVGFILAGCTTINGFLDYSVKTTTPSPTPSLVPSLTLTPTLNLTPNLTPTVILPTPTIRPGPTLGYRVVPSDACSLATLHSLRSDTPAEGFIAWKPGSEELAFVAPRSDQDWYVGDLTVASGKDFSQMAALTKGVQVAGDMLWSADGATIAFVAYRQEDSVYTVMTARENGVPVDLFPALAAHTDAFAGPKQVLQWLTPDHLTVGATCGLDCEQLLDVNVSDGVITKSGDPVRKGALAPAALATEQRPLPTPDSFPTMSGQVWSPDGSQIAFLDAAGSPWLLSVKDHNQFPLNVNNNQVMEMAWSPDGKLLAIRLDGAVDIFKLGCTQ